MGVGPFVWFLGIVEDRNDPLKLGRVRVRCMGFHTDDKTAIPTESLPWAMPIQPITSAAMNGIGQSPLGMVEGTTVIGFFRDGIAAQDPIILGALGGISQTAGNPNKGFTDPNGVYPISDRIGEPDTNRLARNENIEKTIVQSKNDNRIKGIPLANSTETWDEPESPYGAEYTKNHVTETESGHVFEADDTPGKERIHKYHKSGSYEEYQPKGNRTTKIVGKDFEIVVSDKNVYIKGSADVTIEGSSNILVKGDTNIQVGGNVTANVSGNVSANVSGTTTVDSDGDMSLSTKGTLTLQGTKIVHKKA